MALARVRKRCDRRRVEPISESNRPSTCAREKKKKQNPFTVPPVYACAPGHTRVHRPRRVHYAKYYAMIRVACSMLQACAGCGGLRRPGGGTVKTRLLRARPTAVVVSGSRRGRRRRARRVFSVAPTARHWSDSTPTVSPIGQTPVPFRSAPTSAALVHRRCRTPIIYVTPTTTTTTLTVSDPHTHTYAITPHTRILHVVHNIIFLRFPLFVRPPYPSPTVPTRLQTYVYKHECVLHESARVHYICVFVSALSLSLFSVTLTSFTFVRKISLVCPTPVVPPLHCT